MIPVDELRAWVGADASADPLLGILEAAAVARVELWTRAYFGPSASFTHRIIGDGSLRLPLPKYPVTSVTSVTQSWLTDVTPTAVPVMDFVIRTPYLYRTGGGIWELGAEFTVEYTAGYDPAAVPAFPYPVIYYDAVRDIVAARFGARSAATGGAAAETFKSETSPDYSYERFDTGDSAGTATDDSAEESVVAILARLPKRMRI